MIDNQLIQILLVGLYLNDTYANLQFFTNWLQNLHILYYLEFWIGRKTIRIEASGNDYYIVWHNFK